jgi:hypothetical protein
MGKRAALRVCMKKGGFVTVSLCKPAEYCQPFFFLLLEKSVSQQCVGDTNESNDASVDRVDKHSTRMALDCSCYRVLKG